MRIMSCAVLYSHGGAAHRIRQQAPLRGHRVTHPDVLVVGDANPDLILGGDVVPRFGQQEQLLDRAEWVLGGSAAITGMRAMRRVAISRTGFMVLTASYPETTAIQSDLP